jgi:hypothetical protein
MLKLFVLAALALTACIPPGGTYGSFTATVRPTSVFINGIELTQEQEATLEAVLGANVPPGRYYVTDSGLFGAEGQAAMVDLAPLVAAYEARVGSTRTRTADRGSDDQRTVVLDGRGGGLTVSGGCTIASAPDGTTFTSGC